MEQKKVAESSSRDVPQTEERERDEFDTDLEDDAPSEKRSVPLADRHLQACSRAGTVPVLWFLRQLGQASISLSYYDIGPRDTKTVVMVLQDDNNVTSLDLEGNSLRADGAQYIAQLLQRNTNIISLNLSKNDLRVEGADVIAKMMRNNCYVKSINLSENGFDDTSAKYFADALKNDFVIKELNLSHNKFTETGVAHLGQMLEGNQGIEVLNVSWNKGSIKQATAFCAGLKVNSTLEHLLLVSNGFSGYVANSLSDALKENSTLVFLDLRHNLMDDHAVNLLCPGLATNYTLKVLKLSCNPILSAGALILLKTVQNNTRTALEEIDLSTVVVCDVFVELLEEIRRRLPALVVNYMVLPHVTKRLSALPIFKKYLKEHEESLMESFRALDEDGTMKISNKNFRTVVKAAGIPLDHNQIEWLVRKFDSQCTARINYSQFAKMT